MPNSKPAGWRVRIYWKTFPVKYPERDLHPDGRKLSKGRNPYPTYRPYPVSWDVKHNGYSPDDLEDSETTSLHRPENGFLTDFPDLIGEATPSHWSLPRPTTSNDKQAFRPLHLLRSLFSDRLNFLQRALDELELAKQQRQYLTRDAMEDLDSHIRECEHRLSLVLLNHPDEKRHLERRLLELKRERRRENLLSWRDLVWLKGEISKLQRETDSLGGTSKSTENREAPT